MPAAKDACTTVAIVEDHAALGAGLRKIVESAADFRCTGVWISAEEALKKIDAFRPQVVLMDINLPGLSAAPDEVKLSNREIEILEPLTKGLANKEIADRLDISVETVRVHLRRVYEKLHVHSRTEAAMKFRDSKDSTRGPL